jgi:hypothetical protein
VRPFGHIVWCNALNLHIMLSEIVSDIRVDAAARQANLATAGL